LRICIHLLPEFGAGAGVPGEYKAGMARIELVTYRRHRMVCRQRHHLAAIDIDALAHPDRIEKRMKGFSGARDLAEVGPDGPVENMGPDDFERRLGRMDDYRTAAHVAHRIDHERQRGQVVKVRMRDEDVIDLRQFGNRQVADPGSGIDRECRCRPAARWSADADRRFRRCNRCVRFAACAGPPKTGGSPMTGSRDSG
jgi:hypothetical protein